MKGLRGAALLLALVLFVPGPARAGTLRWGFKGGALVADHAGEESGGRDSRVTVGAGFLLAYDLSRRFEVTGELLYSGKGSSIRVIVDVGGTPVETRSTIKLAYVELPLLAVLRFPLGARARVTPKLAAGPSLGIRWECKNTREAGPISFDSDCAALGYDIRPVDLGIALGAGAEVAAGRGAFALEARCVLGFFSIDRNKDLVNRTLGITAGYVAPIGRARKS